MPVKKIHVRRETNAAIIHAKMQTFLDRDTKETLSRAVKRFNVLVRLLELEPWQNVRYELGREIGRLYQAYPQIQRCYDNWNKRLAKMPFVCSPPDDYVRV